MFDIGPVALESLAMLNDFRLDAKQIDGTYQATQRIRSGQGERGDRVLYETSIPSVFLGIEVEGEEEKTRHFIAVGDPSITDPGDTRGVNHILISSSYWTNGESFP